MLHRLRNARDSFWFLPAALGIGALVLAELVVSLDRYLQGASLGVLDAVLVRVGASGSRDILGAIGGSMLGVAATAFSITISVLATTSSSYGPRLVRNFMADRGNQLVLGTFGSTFLYSLVVLRSIRTLDAGDGDTFVPDLAVNLAVLLAVLDVAVLVYFIHHIADSVQVSSLVQRVRRDLVETVDDLYPEQPGAGWSSTTTLPTGPSRPVRAPATGYVQEVLEDRLLAWACEHGAVVEVVTGAGTHVLPSETVARVWGEHDLDLDPVARCFDVDDERSPRQDVRFAVQQLVDMAVRALSPGTNDPYTAQNALSEVAAGLVPLAGRPVPDRGRLDGDGALRLVVVRLPAEQLVVDVFTAVRTHATSAPDVLSCTVQLARRIAGADPTPAVARTLHEQLELLLAAYDASEPLEHDRLALHQHVGTARRELAPAV